MDPLDKTWDYLSAIAGASEADEAISSSEATYNSVKSLILSGRARPGCKLVHQDLATYLNVSRTPVREALERLYQEGFVTRIPRRGFYVAKMTHDEALELYSAREALEAQALRETLARGPLPSSVIDDLKNLVRKYDHLLQEHLIKERVVTDVNFHIRLASQAGNGYIVRILVQTFERLTLKRRIEGYRSDRGEQANQEHRELIAALENNEAADAESILRHHIRRGRDALLNSLREV